MRGKALFFAAVSLAVGLALGQAFAEAPDSLWSRTFGGGNRDRSWSVLQSSDSGYILAGYTASFGVGNDDFWLVKTDADGDSLWSNTFGGSNSDICRSVQQTSDGGYILGGQTRSFGAAGDYDSWLVKTDSLGDSLWSKPFGGSEWDFCRSLQQTPDDGYILAGYTYSFGAGESDFWLVKTDANGDSLWSRTFGGSYRDQCYSLQQTSDGGYILAGETFSFGSGTPSYPNFWLVKTDSLGDSLWSNTFGGSSYERCRSVQQTSDGGYILAGDKYTSGARIWDFWLVKTDSLGTQLWSRIFGESGWEHCYSVQQTSDGGYILAGDSITGAGGQCDVWLIRTDANGDSLWSRTFGGSEDDHGSSVQQTLDGGYAVAGATKSFGGGDYDFWLVKTGPDPISLVPQELVAWVDEDSLRLAWGPAPYATSYNVMWSPLPFDGIWSLLVSTSDTTAADTVGVGGKRFYNVKGVN